MNRRSGVIGHARESGSSARSSWQRCSTRSRSSQRLVDVAAAPGQLGTAYVDLVQEVLELAGLARLLVVHVDDGGDLVQREAETPAAQDQGEPDPVPVVEDAGRAAALGGEQPDVLVVAQRAQGDVVLRGELGDRPRLVVIGLGGSRLALTLRKRPTLTLT